jgi:CDP-glycerol glycerophosphotransferase (TagB/SpsB family)
MGDQLVIGLSSDEFNAVKRSHTWLRKRRLSLYELLGATHLLVSDTSSAVIDYLLLDRPVIHAFADLRVYESSRGFSVE